MLVPVRLLRSFSDPPVSTTALAARLTMTGTKDERWFHYGVADPSGFVVGRVLDAIPHPNADRLRVCTVDVGDPEPATIVCGAPNVAAGQTVAVARPGAVLPDGTKLRSAKLRGVVSAGMILSALELGIGVEHDGILVLETQAAPGTGLADVLPLGTDVIEFEITPNRPDCLGVYGIAREVHAATDAALAPPPWTADPGSAEGDVGGVEIVVECPDLCPRFMARAFADIRIAPSPAWLAADLLAAGMRPINNVVDITNYVMLVSGQPLHAFDLDRVAGRRLVVRRAAENEAVDTLDGQTRRLDAEMVVICDDDGPTSIAGIMGGARSEVEPQTTRVLIEAATWIGANIQRSSARLGLRSEASGRFEKGLEPETAADGLGLASALLASVCDARVLNGTIDVGGPGPPPQVIRLDPERLRGLLGAPIGPDRSAEILTSLGFGVDAAPGGGALDVAVPAFRRADVRREVDLIEEVARIDGVDRLPATLPPRRGAAGRLSHAQRVQRRAEDVLVGRGLHEIVGWSFTDPGLVDRLRLPAGHPMSRVVTIENPLSEAQSVMRPTLLGSLLDVARHNAARGAADVAIFESGTVYRRHGNSARGPAPAGGPPQPTRPPAAADGTGFPGGPPPTVLGRTPVDEHHALGALVTGQVAGRSWRAGPAPTADFFTVKALVAAVLDALRVPGWSVRPAKWPFLHPGRSAEVLIGDRRVGLIGELHPSVAASWDLQRTGVFTLNLDVTADAAPALISYADFGDFPAVLQDISVIVPETVAAAAVVDAVRAHGGPELADVRIFDVYRGSQVGDGRTSLSLHLEFRARDRTLTDADVAARREAITAALGRELGGELRG